MKKYILISILAIFLIAGSIVFVSAADDYGNNYDSNYVDGLNISHDLSMSLEDAKIENKTVMVIFDQDACVYCEMLKDNTLSDSRVQEIINDNCIPVIVDINDDYEIAGKYDVFGTPEIIFLNGDGDELHRINGYVSPDEFLSEVHA